MTHDDFDQIKNAQMKLKKKTECRSNYWRTWFASRRNRPGWVGGAAAGAAVEVVLVGHWVHWLVEQLVLSWVVWQVVRLVKIDPTVEDAHWRENYINQPTYYGTTKANYPDLKL